jgi:hypothetical protein
MAVTPGDILNYQLEGFNLGPANNAGVDGTVSGTPTSVIINLKTLTVPVGSPAKHIAAGYTVGLVSSSIPAIPTYTGVEPIRIYGGKIGQNASRMVYNTGGQPPTVSSYNEGSNIAGIDY